MTLTTALSGKKLFEALTSKRDYSGSEEDNYAQLLLSIHRHIREDIFPLLEKAARNNKKLYIIEDPDHLVSFYSSSDIGLK